MATDNSPTGAAGALPATGAPAPFFHLSADYLIDPASTTEALGTDIVCLHEAVEEIVQSIIEASESNSQIEGRAFAALYAVRQARGIATEYVRRTAGFSPTPTSSSVGPSLPRRDSEAGEMQQALSDASCANNAVRQALDAIQLAVYSDLGPVEQGLFEAAVASTERLERALSRGIEAGAAQ